MSFISRTTFIGLILFTILSQITGHTYLTSPISRSNQAQTQSGCRGPTCLGPCDLPLALARRAPIVAARGDHIVVNWPRNNHAGGFIRFAWAPTSQSDSHAAFDNHVQQISCHESGNNFPGGCLAADPINDPNGGGSGPADGSYGACTTNISVPTDLTDGKWTLQWAWFGGAFSLGDYYSCVDYSISGGVSIAPAVPVFKGGDVTYPGQDKCKFFNTDQLHVCINEPCNRPLFSGEQSGRPSINQFGSNFQLSTTGIVRPITSNQANVQSSIVTTSRSIPSSNPSMTTSQNQPSRPSTTQQAQVQVNVPSSQPNLASCSLARKTSSSLATIQTVESWGNQFHMVVNVVVQELSLENWVVAISLPTTSFQVDRFFNSGALRCKEDNVLYFSPVAFWANNLPSGLSFQVEFIGSLTGDASNFNSILSSIKTQSRAVVFTS